MENTIYDNWNQILNCLKEEFDISPVSYRTWLSKLKFKNIIDGYAIIYPDDNEIGSNINLIQKKYGKYIKTSIEEVTGIQIEVKIINNEDTSSEVKVFEESVKKNTNLGLTLNPDYTFDNFVVSSNNSMVHAAALNVAEAPGEYYNPLYIYGEPGLGKTHLMHSIAHYILENSPSLKIMYVTSEVFMNELVESIRLGKVSPADFREKYRNIDVLLIDDIQFIIGKESTQQEFFFTFNYLYEAKKQIVISSDKPPRDFNNLEERLRSRFECGFMVDLTAPDFEAKVAILKKKIELKQNEDHNIIDISDEVLAYIAQNIKTNIRSLEGALTTIIARSKLSRKPITLELAEESLRNIISPDQKKIITSDYIINLVAEHFSLNVNDIYSPKRDKEIAIPRQIAMYLLKEYTSLTTIDIGKKISRDHTTVLHGIKTIKNKIQEDTEIANNVNTLIKKLNIDD